MRYDRATEEFEKILDKHPNDPFAVNHLLTVVLMHNLYDTGAMNTGDYSNDSFIGRAPRPTDTKVKDRIKQLARRAEDLEEQELKSNPEDVNALYCRGVTRAEFSVYTGLMERAWFSALRNAVGARHDHERVLELDPSYVDAKMVVGTHNYVIGRLPWSVKVAAALAGLSGSAEKGLDYLREVAKSDGENSADAKVILSLFLRREHQYDEAIGYMNDLSAKFPGNHLFPTEVANLERAAGRLDEAEAMYRKVWQNGREGKYGKLHYELAAWGLGELLRAKKDVAGAAAAYDSGQPSSQPRPRYPAKSQPGSRRNVRPAAEARPGHEEISNRPRRQRQHHPRRSGPPLHQRSLPGIKGSKLFMRGRAHSPVPAEHSEASVI